MNTKFLRYLWSWFLLAALAYAQNIEVSCPPGTSNIGPVSPTQNLATGNLKQWLCQDVNGNPFEWGQSSITAGADTGGVTKSAFRVNNAGTGDIDLFTVPTGKRAFAIYQDFNTAGTTTTFFGEVKISGTYYRITANGTRGTLVAGSSGWQGIILEAGQTFSINYSQSGENVWGTAFVFPNTANLRSAILTSLASGENTIYTCCPSGRTTASILLGNSQILGSGNAAIIETSNGSGGALNYYYSIVTSGGSPGAGNKAVPTTAIANGATSNYGAFNNFTLALGDFISINASGTSANTLSWVTLEEQ